MDKTARAKLIRERFKAKGGIPYVGKGRLKPQIPAKAARIYIPWPETIPDTKRAPEWFMEPERGNLKPVWTRRIYRPTALTKMAEIWMGLKPTQF